MKSWEIIIYGSQDPRGAVYRIWWYLVVMLQIATNWNFTSRAESREEHECPDPKPALFWPTLKRGPAPYLDIDKHNDAYFLVIIHGISAYRSP